jgi:homogentisate 1,2-dioxygenase
MPMYHRLGQVPRKRHIAFRKEDGSLYPEELIGNKGFVGPSSLVYHLYRPTTARSLRSVSNVAPEPDGEPTLTPRHFRPFRVPCGPSAVLGRVPLLFNSDVTISFATPTEEDDFFYRNGQADELVYVADGGGVLESTFGDLDFRRGDYLVIPRGVLHRYRLFEGVNRLLVVESAGYVRTPKRYRNEHGQLTENAPFSERDIRVPAALNTRDEKGDFRCVIKKEDRLTEAVLDHHPFDVVGWDGYYYPWAFNIEDFEPRSARIHLPPPVHQTFEGDGFVVCSFCPRPFDWEKDAVPAPYNHSNVMSEEVLFYASDEFMSRKGVEYGSITLHPDGLPHGPQPGKAEESIGKTWTNELAVMVDTFKPLHVTRQAAEAEDKTYYRSWLEDEA